MTEVIGEIVVIKRNGADGTRFPLHGRCTFGRDSKCDIRIIKTDVEAEHVSLDYEEGKMWISNLSKLNPPLLNNAMVNGKDMLCDKDVFTIGGRSFRYEGNAVVSKPIVSKRKSSLIKTPLGSYQGSPRTPAPKEDLRQSIKRLEKSSTSLSEEREVSPAILHCSDKENHVTDQGTPRTQGLLKRKSLGSCNPKKRVSFGGNLSPELFDKTLPPNTPLRKGSTPNRRSMSEASQAPLIEKSEKIRRSVSFLPSLSTMDESSEIHSVDVGTPKDDNELFQLVEDVDHSREETILAHDQDPESEVSQEPLTKVMEKQMRRSLKADIEANPKLKSTKKRMRQSLQAELKNPPKLKETKRKMRQSLQGAIAAQPQLRETKKRMRQSLQSEIKSAPSLKETKRRMRKSLQAQILLQPALKKTKMRMRKSLQQAIFSRPSLRETKRRMRKSLQNEICQPRTLKKTKKKMRQSLQAEIISQPPLRGTKKKMRKSLQEEIKNPPALRETKPKMRRSLQNEIIQKPALRETKKKLGGALQEEIKNPPKLKETKKKMRKSLQAEIIDKPRLKETKKKMKESLQTEIKNPPPLRSTKRRLRKSLQALIVRGFTLNATRKKVSTPLRREIQGKPSLRKVKKTIPKALNTPIRKDILSKPVLRKTLKRLQTPLRMDIKKGVELKGVKDRYPALDDNVQSQIKSGKTLKKTKIIAPTPLRHQIKSGIKLKKTKLPVRCSLQGLVSSGPLLKETLKKSLASEDKVEIQGVSDDKKKSLKARRRLPKGFAVPVTMNKLEGNTGKDEVLEPPKKRQRRGSALGSTTLEGCSTNNENFEDNSQMSENKSKIERKDQTEDFTGVSRILKTPRIKTKTVTDLSGVSRIMKTPKLKLQKVNDLSGISRLMKTPRIKGSPVDDLTGLSKMMKTPRNGPVTDYAGVSRLVKTPKTKGKTVDGAIAFDRLVREPRVKAAPVEDFAGVARILKTPKVKGEVIDDLAGVKRIFKTPKAKNPMVEDLTGIAEMMEIKESGPTLETTCFEITSTEGESCYAQDQSVRRKRKADTAEHPISKKAKMEEEVSDIVELPQRNTRRTTRRGKASELKALSVKIATPINILEVAGEEFIPEKPEQKQKEEKKARKTGRRRVTAETSQVESSALEPTVNTIAAVSTRSTRSRRLVEKKQEKNESETIKSMSVDSSATSEQCKVTEEICQQDPEKPVKSTRVRKSRGCSKQVVDSVNVVGTVDRQTRSGKSKKSSLKRELSVIPEESEKGDEDTHPLPSDAVEEVQILKNPRRTRSRRATPTTEENVTISGEIASEPTVPDITEIVPQGRQTRSRRMKDSQSVSDEGNEPVHTSVVEPAGGYVEAQRNKRARSSRGSNKSTTASSQKIEITTPEARGDNEEVVEKRRNTRQTKSARSLLEETKEGEQMRSNDAQMVAVTRRSGRSKQEGLNQEVETTQIKTRRTRAKKSSSVASDVSESMTASSSRTRTSRSKVVKEEQAPVRRSSRRTKS